MTLTFNHAQLFCQKWTPGIKLVQISAITNDFESFDKILQPILGMNDLFVDQ